MKIYKMIKIEQEGHQMAKELAASEGMLFEAYAFKLIKREYKRKFGNPAPIPNSVS